MVPGTHPVKGTLRSHRMGNQTPAAIPAIGQCQKSMWGNAKVTAAKVKPSPSTSQSLMADRQWS
jgi:hypothetical protein